MEKKKLEIDIQKEILEYLTKKGYFCWRNNNVPIFDKNLNSGYGGYRAQSKWCPKGLPDVFFIDPEAYGQLVGLEVKRPKGGKRSPDQLLIQKRFHTNNARFEFVKSVEEVKALGY